MKKKLQHEKNNQHTLVAVSCIRHVYVIKITVKNNAQL